MQALRKAEIEGQGRAQGKARSERFVDAADLRAALTAHLPGPRQDGAATSPALALRDHLAARLDQLAEVQASDTAALAAPEIEKLPMAARMGVILGLSISLWLAVYLAAVAVL